MDQALGIEKASLATVVSLSSSVLDIYESSLRFTPVFGDLIDMVSQAVACSMELQMNWLSLFAPYASLHVATPTAVSRSAPAPPKPSPQNKSWRTAWISLLGRGLHSFTASGLTLRSIPPLRKQEVRLYGHIPAGVP